MMRGEVSMRRCNDSLAHYHVEHTHHERETLSVREVLEDKRKAGHLGTKDGRGCFESKRDVRGKKIFPTGEKT